MDNICHGPNNRAPPPFSTFYFYTKPQTKAHNSIEFHENTSQQHNPPTGRRDNNKFKKDTQARTIKRRISRIRINKEDTITPFSLGLLLGVVVDGRRFSLLPSLGWRLGLQWRISPVSSSSTRPMCWAPLLGRHLQLQSCCSDWSTNPPQMHQCHWYWIVVVGLCYLWWGQQWQWWRMRRNGDWPCEINLAAPVVIL